MQGYHSKEFMPITCYQQLDRVFGDDVHTAGIKVGCSLVPEA